MTTNNTELAELKKPSGWQEFWLKEDWWAVWLGLGIVLLAYVFYLAGSSISWIAVAPAKWSTFSQLATQFSTNAVRYLALLGVFLILFTIVVSFIGQKPRAFIPSFIFVFILSAIIYFAGNWDQASKYNLEPPLVALVLGLIISNLIGLPRWLDAGFRVEFFIKLGIVLLGATLPFTLIIWAGPVAILQASIVSIVTFLVIFFTARKLGLDQPAGCCIGCRWCGLRSFCVDRRGRRRARQKGAPAHRDQPGRILGDRFHFRVATGFTFASPAHRSRRSMDRNLGIRRCGRACRCAILWRTGR